MTSVNYTVTLSQVEDIAMSTIAFDVFDWIDNAAKNRARIALEELVQKEVKRRFEAGEAIPSSRDEMILDAYARGFIVSLKDVAADSTTSQPTSLNS